MLERNDNNLTLDICFHGICQKIFKFYKKNKKYLTLLVILFIAYELFYLGVNCNIKLEKNLLLPQAKKNYYNIFNFTEEEITEIYANLGRGGRKNTSHVNQHVAIIVPYRDRPLQLSIFLRHMHYFLSKQPINYGIFIVEQVANQTFNRGKLMNIGFLEALKDGPWNCFFFHDVDLIPENLFNYYKCRRRPTHFSAAIDILNYTVPYYSNFGGVTAMFRNEFEKLNGFSNIFWGWGYEDDELRKRLLATGSKFYRLPKNVGRYTMISHKRDEGNPESPKICRMEYLNKAGSRFHMDGLNTINYIVKKLQKRKLYTHLVADLLEKEENRKSTNSICLF